MTFRNQFDHHDALLAAALDEFCGHGYDAASINRILAASGVSKGQLYHHFDGKQGLFLGLVEWLVDAKLRWATTRPIVPPAPDFFDALDQQIRLALDFAATNPGADRLAKALLAERGRPIYTAVVERFGFGTDSPIDALVQHHHALGAFPPDLPAPLIRRTVALLVNHTPELLDLEHPDDLARGRHHLIELLRHGLRARTD